MEFMRADQLVLAAGLLLLQLPFACALVRSPNRTTAAAPLVPAIIAFGDSIVDPGNNDVLTTIIKCNFPPYGQNFAGGATGRFSNGFIPTDLIAQTLGVKQLLPPYLGVDLSPEDILTGVSFASGATGYDPLTPKILNVIPMRDQLDLFSEYRARLYSIAGPDRGAEIISKALFIICAGTDDLANTYFTTPFRRNYDVPSYINLLISSASEFIRQVVGIGATKIGFVGLPPIGCVPSQRTLGGGKERRCEATRNQAAQLFNSRIQTVIKGLSAEFTQVKIVYIGIYDILLDLVQRPGYYGFKESTKGCCGSGEIEVTLLCNSKTVTTCSDVNEYVFWDSYHPTEKAYKIVVNNIFTNYLRYLL
ncbi:GDSL esterase/lipase EXL3-like [Zingiber officinale]|uniref:GDSL esterase/lipase EXL3-like n=1 Tax=Zingiber officinale TaxID=94328 RepID=UPI001C4CD262|nr:GDSL esterase/lipase EXL3-like [Zingiber officinale]